MEIEHPELSGLPSVQSKPDVVIDCYEVGLDLSWSGLVGRIYSMILAISVFDKKNSMQSKIDELTRSAERFSDEDRFIQIRHLVHVSGNNLLKNLVDQGCLNYAGKPWDQTMWSLYYDKFGNGYATPGWTEVFGRDDPCIGKIRTISWLKKEGVEEKIRLGVTADFDVTLNLSLLSAPFSPIYQGLQEKIADYDPETDELFAALRKVRNTLSHEGQDVMSLAEYAEHLTRLLPVLQKRGVTDQELDWELSYRLLNDQRIWLLISKDYLMALRACFVQFMSCWPEILLTIASIFLLQHGIHKHE